MILRSRDLPVAVIFLAAVYLFVPVCFPFFAENISAQDPVPVTHDHPADQSPADREDLEGGGIRYIYKNRDGIVWKEEDWVLGVMIRRETILRVYPSGQEAFVKIDHLITGVSQRVNYSRNGEPESRSTATTTSEEDVVTSVVIKEIWRDREQSWVPAERIVSSFDAIHDLRILSYDKEIWDRETQTWVRIQTFRREKSTRGGKPGYKAESKITAGMHSTTFQTPEGNIHINLPDGLAPGDTISGSIYISPGGKDPKEQVKNSGRLAGYVVELDGDKTNTDSQTFVPFKWNIRKDSFGLSQLVLKDKKGNVVARSEVLVLPLRQEILEGSQIPEIGQQGEPLNLHGNFDGDFSTSAVTIGGKNVPIIAESPRKLFAFNNSEIIGVTDLEIRENGVTRAKRRFRSVGINLSAPKLDLLRGEQTILTVKVLGLEGITKPVPLLIENNSPKVINMGGGNLQKIMIPPNEVKGGIYTTTRQLTGITRGSFTITGTVTVDEEDRGTAPPATGVK